ncbi:MAG: hypothetical protein WCS17_10405 [Prevotella sp.]
MDNKLIAGIVVVILIVSGVGIYFALFNNNGNNDTEELKPLETFEDMKEGDYYTYTFIYVEDGYDKTLTMTTTLKTVSGDDWTIRMVLGVNGEQYDESTHTMTKAEYIESVKTSNYYEYIDFNELPSEFVDLTKDTSTIHLNIGDRNDVTFEGTITNEYGSTTVNAAYSEKGVLYDMDVSSTESSPMHVTLTATSMYF